MSLTRHIKKRQGLACLRVNLQIDKQVVHCYALADRPSGCLCVHGSPPTQGPFEKNTEEGELCIMVIGLGEEAEGEGNWGTACGLDGKVVLVLAMELLLLLVVVLLEGL